MLMELMEISVSQGASQGRSIYSQGIWPGAPWGRATTGEKLAQGFYTAATWRGIEPRPTFYQ